MHVMYWSSNVWILVMLAMLAAFDNNNGLIVFLQSPAPGTGSVPELMFLPSLAEIVPPTGKPGETRMPQHTK